MPLALKRKSLDSQPPQLDMFPRLILWKLNLALFLAILFPSLQSHFSFHPQILFFSLFTICSLFSFPPSNLPPIEMGPALTSPTILRRHPPEHIATSLRLHRTHFSPFHMYSP